VQREIDGVPAEDGEVEMAEGVEGIEGIGGIGVMGKVEAAISSGADPDSVDSSSMESIAGMAITVPIPTIYHAARNSPMED